MNGKRSCKTRVTERESKMQRRDREQRCCALLAFGKKYGNRKTSFFGLRLWAQNTYTPTAKTHTHKRARRNFEPGFKPQCYAKLFSGLPTVNTQRDLRLAPCEYLINGFCLPKNHFQHCAATLLRHPQASNNKIVGQCYQTTKGSQLNSY